MMTLISGTNRRGSKTRLVTDLVANLYREAGAKVDVLDLVDLPLALFSPDAYAEKPSEFGLFAEQILKSEGLVVLTPEYNGSMPGALKLFIDHLKFPESFEGRPVAFIGLAAGQWGGLRAVEQLQQIFGYRNAFIYPRRVFIPQVYRAINDSGHLTDPEVERHLRAQTDGFLGFVQALRAGS
ncbi:MAG: NADPH-dependent FMN reductase [Candidatus Methylacidiphilales bacterium]